MKEVDFTEAELGEASFTGSNLEGAKFERTDLRKADFRGAQNYLIDPRDNKVQKAKFSREGLEGLVKSLGVIVE